MEKVFVIRMPRETHTALKIKAVQSMQSMHSVILKLIEDFCNVKDRVKMEEN